MEFSNGLRMKNNTKQRENQILDRIRKSLHDEGIVNRQIVQSEQYGIGSSKSYFEALIDIKLAGKEIPTAQTVWEELKAQINYLTGALLKASKDYSILETKVRGLQDDSKDLLKETNSRPQLFTDETYLQQLNVRTPIFRLSALEVGSHGEGDFTIGIFSTEEKAENAFVKFLKDDPSYSKRYAKSIDPMFLDEVYI